MKNLILITFLSLLNVLFSQKSIETFNCGSSTFQIKEGKLFNLNNNLETKVNTGAKNITCFSTDGKNIVLGTLYQGIFLSRDYGVTWEKNVIETYQNFDTKNILSLKIDFHRIYAMVNTGKFQLLYFTKDYGKSWETKKGIESAGKQEFDLGEGPTSVKKIEIDTNYIIAVCVNQSKYMTENKGGNWMKYDSLVIVKSKSDYRQSVLNWQKNPLNQDKERFKDFDGGYKYCELTLGEFLYAGTGKGLFRSKDKGKTWEKINNGIHDCSIWKMYQIDNNLIIHTHDGMSYFSSNYGDSWEEVRFDRATGSLKEVVANSRMGFMLMDKGLYVSRGLGAYLEFF